MQQGRLLQVSERQILARAASEKETENFGSETYTALR